MLINKKMRYLFLIFILSFTLVKVKGQTVAYGFNEEKGGYFEVANNTKLYYEIYGEGEPLLMLHGGVYGYINEFEYFIPFLAEKYQVICLATRGHVKSDIGHEPFTYDQRASDAFKLIQHLKLNKVTVIGFSDGGHSAFKLAANYPEVVDKMIVMGAGNQPAEELPTYNYNADDLMASSGDYFKERLKHMPEPDRWNESLQMLSQLYNTSVVSDETFKKIKCPVLVMAGDHDEYAKPSSFVEAYEAIPAANLSIIPGCGHVIFYCKFPVVWETMKGFLGFQDK